MLFAFKCNGAGFFFFLNKLFKTITWAVSSTLVQNWYFKHITRMSFYNVSNIRRLYHLTFGYRFPLSCKNWSGQASYKFERSSRSFTRRKYGRFELFGFRGARCDVVCIVDITERTNPAGNVEDVFLTVIKYRRI